MTQPSLFGKVAVLMGGRSAEREVSLRSGSGILKALKDRGVDAWPFDPGVRSLSELAAEKFDRAFIALHGRFGEDGTMQGVLEHLGIPYTGSGVMASAVSMDKMMTKRIWIAEGLPTPRHISLDESSDWKKVEDELALPLIVKPAHEGSSLGIERVQARGMLKEAYERARRFDESVFAEAFIDGLELTCAILDIAGRPTALPLVRIIAPGAEYSYENKYFSKETVYLCPSGLEPDLEEKIKADALKAYEVLGCRGWARADIMLRGADNRAFLLEMNACPGMTDQSLVPMAAREIGIDYGELCLMILGTAALNNEKVRP